MNLNPFARISAVAFILASLLCLNGCTTNPPKGNASARPGSGLAEYLEVVNHARQAVDGALSSLDSLDRHTGTAPQTVVSAFSDEVDRLSSASVRIRARTEAMQTRGDAYFENWQENMASIADPKIRASAEQHRGELQHSFGKIKATLQETRQSFQQFLKGLRELRTTLEADSAKLASDSTRHSVLETRRAGDQVRQGLTAVSVELQHMTALLIPSDAAARN